MTRFAAWLALLMGVAATALAAGASTSLDSYLSGLRTWSADFTQSSSQVSRDGRERQTDAGRGRLIIVRPGRFRWEFAPAGAAEAAQLMIADGQDLWSLDHDLEQATRKPLKDALQQAPVMLLAGDDSLRTAYDILPDSRKDGLDWTRVVPKDKQSDVREARFGFKGNELARIEILDKLGQRSTLVFSRVRRNAEVDPALMKFTLPPGVDLIGEPLK